MNYLQVYILKCSDRSYYTGVTNDVERRLWEHQQGIDTNSYTYYRRPVELVWYSDEFDPKSAIEFEKQIKGWNRRKKEALINGEWDMLPELSKCVNESSHLNFKNK